MKNGNSAEKPRIVSHETEYRFSVRKLDDGTPWIVLEPQTKTLEVLRRGLLGLDLKLGTSFEEAEEELADHLNRLIASVARVKSWEEMNAASNGPVPPRFRTAIENRPIRDQSLLALDPLGAVQHMDAAAEAALPRARQRKSRSPCAGVERH